MDAAVAGAGVGIVLSVVPSQYNTPVYRTVAGGMAAYFGNGYIREGGKLLIGMEAARLTSKAVANTGLTATAGGSSGLIGA